MIEEKHFSLRFPFPLHGDIMGVGGPWVDFGQPGASWGGDVYGLIMLLSSPLLPFPVLCSFPPTAYFPLDPE